MIYILSKTQLEGINKIIEIKNDLSIFNSFKESDLSYKDRLYLIDQGLLNEDKSIKDEDILDTLANPSSICKFMFTGGINKFEYFLLYDSTRDIKISFSVIDDHYIINDNISKQDIMDVIGDFTGKSKIKSLDIKQMLSPEEAIVLAALIDLERKNLVRSLVHEIPYTSNRYGINMTSRMMRSTNKNIQWFVYCVHELLGEKSILDLDEIKDNMDSLKEKGILSEEYGQYQLNNDYSKLANRMIINASVLTMETRNISKNMEKSVGFTCLQSSVHDIILLESNSTKVYLQTISSERLLEYIDKLLDINVL